MRAHTRLGRKPWSVSRCSWLACGLNAAEGAPFSDTCSAGRRQLTRLGVQVDGEATGAESKIRITLTTSKSVANLEKVSALSR